jgi:hypothetical protein
MPVAIELNEMLLLKITVYPRCLSGYVREASCAFIRTTQGCAMSHDPAAPPSGAKARTR